MKMIAFYFSVYQVSDRLFQKYIIYCLLFSMNVAFYNLAWFSVHSFTFLWNLSMKETIIMYVVYR